MYAVEIKKIRAKILKKKSKNKRRKLWNKNGIGIENTKKQVSRL